MSPDTVAPLQQINWRKEYYLSRFIDKLLESSTKTRIKQCQVENLRLYNEDLQRIFQDIALIVSRINQDGAGSNRMSELLEIANNRRLTGSEEKEIETLPLVVNFLDLDVRCLLIFITIFMDKLAWFLVPLITEKLSNYSFYHFSKGLAKLRGKEIEEFGRLINNNTAWFEKVRRLRRVFVVHHPGAGGALVFRNGKGHVALTTRKRINREREYIIKNSQARDISIDELDRILRQLKKLLKILDEYLCSHIDVLPVEACKASDAQIDK